MSVHTNTLKKFATGSGRASKYEMEQAAAQMKPYPPGTWPFPESDEADAILVSLWGYEQAAKRDECGREGR